MSVVNTETPLGLFNKVDSVIFHLSGVFYSRSQVLDGRCGLCEMNDTGYRRTLVPEKPTGPVNHVSVGRQRRYVGRSGNFRLFSAPPVHRRAPAFFLSLLLASKNQHVGQNFVKVGRGFCLCVWFKHQWPWSWPWNKSSFIEINVARITEMMAYFKRNLSRVISPAGLNGQTHTAAHLLTES